MQSSTDTTKGAPRNLVVLSDGTGNGAGAFWKTNVWRVYQALDLAEFPKGNDGKAEGLRRQIAWYDDGVGTSSFRPLALLGGAVGWGLKRNVLDLYTFLCRNYRPGDRIYAFGFSRGAFTVRIVVDMVAEKGLLAGLGRHELARAARDAYREYRDCFNQTGKHIDLFRWIRKQIIRRWRQAWNQDYYDKIKENPHHTEVKSIAFIGVWDTVAAYGLPLQELTRGIDYWVWPLSMPNYALHKDVERACHALALDDERDTFHPLIWDEIDDPRPNRIQQVWFAGMHADVGGGYPDDALAHVPLRWMMECAEEAGLRFKDSAWKEVDRLIDPFGPLHDSRRGLGSYYRYQPRRVSARINETDQFGRIMQPPDRRRQSQASGSPSVGAANARAAEGAKARRKGPPALMKEPVKVHESVLQRIKEGTDEYAPIVLPNRFVLAGSNGTIVDGEPMGQGKERFAAQEGVWDEVWKRRVFYFATVGLSLIVAALPLIQRWMPPEPCEHVLCFAAPAISSIRNVLPAFLAAWIDAFAKVPLSFLGLVAAIVAFTMKGAALQQRIQSQMRALWSKALALDPSESKEMPKSWIRRLLSVSWIQPRLPKISVRRLRGNKIYRKFFRALKWHIVPHAFGVLVLVILVLLAAFVPHRANLALAEISGRVCAIAHERKALGGQAEGSVASSGTFAPSDPCWDTGFDVVEGGEYRITLNTAKDDGNGENSWLDDTIPVTPAKFTEGVQLPWYVRWFAWPVRRSLTDDWFQPMAKVIPSNRKSSGQLHPLTFRKKNGSGTTYVAQFTAPRTGRLQLFVNDAVPWWGGLSGTRYANNHGVAAFTIDPSD
jgi:uncharacterized protein (DUF2235 family)